MLDLLLELLLLLLLPLLLLPRTKAYAAEAGAEVAVRLNDLS